MDTSNLEQSPTQMRLTFLNFLNAQQMTNHHLHEQVQQSAQTQQQQAAAFYELTDIQCSYNQMFASILTFEISKRDEFFEWLESCGPTCIQSE